MLHYFPKYFSSKAIITYSLVQLVLLIIFSSNAISWYFIVIGVLSVVVFFYYSNYLSIKWESITPKLFEKKLFITALIIRLVYVFFIYWFNYWQYGVHIEAAGPTDIGFYMDMGKDGAEMIRHGQFNFYEKWSKWGIGFDDTGYPVFLSFIYFLTGSEIIVPYIIKSILGAFTCLFLYRFAARSMSESVGRLAGIFCMLNIFMWFWSGSMMKEAEMVFVVVFFIERMDFILRTKGFSIINFISVTLFGLILFTFRSALGAVAYLAIFTTLVYSNQKIISWGKRILISVFIIAILGVALTDRVYDEISNSIESKQSLDQSENLEWRANREGGNKLLTKITGAVFAPLIFTIPFPTMVDTNQPNQILVSGGYYAKNLISFFVVFGLIILLVSGEWRKHILPLSFMLGYLVVLLFSAFPHSGRFHMPIIPFQMMFGAYGVSIMSNKHKSLYNYWLIALFIILLLWNYFKLLGRM